MNLSALFIKRPVTTTLVMLGILVFGPLSYQKSNPGDQSIILLVLRSPTLPLSMIDEYAQQTIAQRLSMVDGVAQVDVFGSQKYAVRIDLDPRELASRGIGIDQVATAV